MVVLGDSSPICLGKTERGIGHQQLEWYQQEAWQALKSEEIGSESLWLSPANKHLWKAGYFKMESCMEREFRVMSGAPGTFQGVVGTIRVALFTISFWFSLFDFFKLRYSPLFSSDSWAPCLSLSPAHANISFFQESFQFFKPDLSLCCGNMQE